MGDLCAGYASVVVGSRILLILYNFQIPVLFDLFVRL